MPTITSKYYRNQAGSAMFLALIILVVLTLLSVFASSSGVLQERMTGNFRDSARAFEAAESGARWAEAWFSSLRDTSQRPFPCGGPGTCAPGRIGSVGQVAADGTVVNTYQSDFFLLDNAWWLANAATYGFDFDNGGVTAPTTNALDPTIPNPYVRLQPRLVLEEVFFARDDLSIGSTGVNFYRITSRATGGIDNNLAVVESTFARRYE